MSSSGSSEVDRLIGRRSGRGGSEHLSHLASFFDFREALNALRRIATKLADEHCWLFIGAPSKLRGYTG
jgi:hypothetical protein